MRHLLLVVTMLPVLWSCSEYAPTALPAVPGKGGPVWIEITAPHFAMWTDLPREEAEFQLRHMEGVRALMVRLVLGGSESEPVRSRVIAQRRWGDWALHGGGNALGFFQPSDRSPFGIPYLAFAAGEMSQSRIVHSGSGTYELSTVNDPIATLQHELTHLVLHALLPKVPAWLDEGLATYFQRAHIDVGAGRAEVGRLPADLGALVRGSGMASVAAVVSSGRTVDRHKPAFYVTSYLLVSFLLNRHPDLFDAYVRALKQAGAEDHATVWQSVFGEEAFDAIQFEMQKWLAGGKVTVLSYDIPPSDFVTQDARPLSDADVHAIRALLYLVVGRGARKGPSLANAAAALDLDPTHLLATVCKFGAGGTIAPEQARRIAEVHPDEWIAWWLVMLTAPDENGKIEAQRRMCALTARDRQLLAPDDLYKRHS